MNVAQSGLSPIRNLSFAAVLLWAVAPGSVQAMDVINPSDVAWTISGEFDGGKEA